ncbi:MAG: DinB family protein [Planctomycetota bacterium]
MTDAAFDPARIADELAGFPDALRALTAGLDDAAARAAPPGGGWSLLDVAGHLLDEEVLDFRPRLESALRDPSAPWPPIDPEGRAEEVRSSLGTLVETVERFADERRASVAWLRGVEAPDWGATYAHPELGPLRAGDLLLSWAAHDLLHTRQVVRLRYLALHRAAESFGSRYAGPPL